MPKPEPEPDTKPPLTAIRNPPSYDNHSYVGVVAEVVRDLLQPFFELLYDRRSRISAQASSA